MMRRFPMMQVDAFSSVPLRGNACAVVLDADGLSDEQMQAIAREMNLAETAFVSACNDDWADFTVRYFTPAVEIPLAGHPTLATARALVDSGRFSLPGDEAVLRLKLQVGVIPVTLTSENGLLKLARMRQPKPVFLAKLDPAEATAVFGLTVEDLAPDVPVQVVSTGTPQLQMALRSLKKLRRVRVVDDAFRELRDRHQFLSAHLFCQPGLSPEAGTFARHFDVPPDLPEDAFTGSATGGMAAFLWHYGLLDQPHLIAEQGHWMKRPGRALVTVHGPRDAIEAVDVAGETVTVIRGELTI